MMQTAPWLKQATTNPMRWNCFRLSTVASARSGTAAAARRFTGYQMLPYLKNPHAQARTAMTMPPTMPPFTPAMSGGTSTGMRMRWPRWPILRNWMERAVVCGFGSSPTGTWMCFGCGKTSRNHPLKPNRAMSTPIKEMKKLVTNPKKISESPNAAMIGQPVGSGISMVFGFSLSWVFIAECGRG